MAVMMPREKWNDEKLDDLDKKIDKGFADTQAEMRVGFARVDGEIKRLDGEIKRLDGNIKSLDENLTQLGHEIHARFEGLNRTLIGGLLAVVAAIIGSSAF